jgi:hypothetical protein
MTRKIIDIGQKGNDGTGDSLRESFRKINDNFTELYSAVGLGDALTFTGLIDTPNTYIGNDNAIVSVNTTGTQLTFKQLIGGSGVTFDFTTNPNEIVINAAFSNIQSDNSPQLGGPVNAFSGGERYPIGGLPDLNSESEVNNAIAKLTSKFPSDTQSINAGRLAVNKSYADSKVSRAGIDSIDTNTGLPDPNQGVMSGPLILARDPVADDDIGPYAGRIAATKRYVDNASYFSRVNLYVSTTGNDNREELEKNQQGRALAYAFKSIEAAAKRAEEIILEAPLELGPYKKKLTYTVANVTFPCTLTSIVTSPLSGVGATAVALMTLDTIVLNATGAGYLPNDLISISGGNGTSQIVVKVLSSEPGTGAILTFEVTATGNYSELPQVVDSPTITNSDNGSGATFDLKFKVNSISVTEAGSGYNLVSVRISGGGGSGAFAEADVVSGSVASVSLTSQGSGYTSIPTVTIELPRFKIDTAGQKTDYTKSPGPSRDIREGLFIRGISSGALANILAHNGDLDGTDELFDVDIVAGAFIIGEELEYGDPVKTTNITIIVESGTYQENFPIKVPANVSIAGDEFRRTIIRPKPGMSTSPWAGIHFCRDTVIDGLTTAAQRFGRHYLTDSTEPIYPLINNPGGYTSAAQILVNNRSFIKSEVVAWIEAQKTGNISPFTSSFTYNVDLCKRDVGLLVDAMVFDLKYGGQSRTVSAALKYYMGATDLGNSLVAITTQKAETLAAITRINAIAQSVLDNVPPDATFQTVDRQVINPAIVAESASFTVFSEFISMVVDILDDDDNFNKPKNNDEMDVYLMNDATRLYQQTIQGAGGFALVLDPEGQILTKSPYAQVGTVFGKSTGKQTFTGSLFIDGFAGNQQFVIDTKPDNFTLNVSELVRKPQAPFSFFRNGNRYTVNYIRNYQFDPNGSTAQFILDEQTPYTAALFTYNESKCARDVGLIIDAVTADLVFGSNYQSTKAGLSYVRSYSGVVTSSQLFETVQAINYSRDQALLQVSDPAARSIITSRYLVVTNIIQRGTTAIPTLVYPNTVNATTATFNASVLLRVNKQFVQNEIVAWVNNEIADGPGSSGATIWNGFTYDSDVCFRDIGYIVDGLIFDLLYSGNLSVVDIANSYYNGSGVSVFPGQTAQSAAAYTRLKTVVQAIVVNTTVTPSPGNTATQVKDLANPGGAGDATTLGTLTDVIIAGVTDQSSIPSATAPDYSASTNTIYKAARTAIQSVKSTIQADTITQINNVISKFELITPGNRSMLSNDFTCINDMGYGLLATNGGLTEAVSMFTYYCYTAYYSLNGGQIRSIGGSSANGVFGLKAEGSDPLEIPDIVFLEDNISQGATVYAPGGLSPYQSTLNGLFLYVEVDDYQPYNQSEIEIDHGGIIGITRYLISSADTVAGLPGVYKINISTTGAGNTSTSGLKAIVDDATRITIRSIFTFKLSDVTEIIQTRPSTALVLLENTERVYRVLSINSAGLPAGQARVQLRENYDFIDALVYTDGSPTEQPADHGDVGDTKVAVTNLATQDAVRAVGSQFCWKGTLHTITAYENSVQTGEDYARLTFTPAIVDTMIGYQGQLVLRAGAQRGMSGDITAQISTARFTGHDLLDIGTGSYADSNYPDVIYGIPANPKDPQKEVQEIGKGRVFFVSTDQDGNFRVGDLFRVDQGTGTVTFAASIALSSLDGLGFKRGVSIAEFSTDDTFSDNATDTIPVEQAVRAYIDRRLGVNHNGGIVTQENIIPANTGGYMALNGSLPMKADMDLGSFKIVNVEDPINALDAVNKRWHTLGNLQDAALTSPTNASFLAFTGVGTSTVNAAMTGDVTVTRSGNTLTSAITAGSIVNADINASAAIAQTKIALNDSTAAATAGAAVKGIASFDSANFETASGWVGIKANGIALTEIAQIAGRSVVANNSIASGNVTAVGMDTVVNNGGAVKKSQFSAIGYLKRINAGDFGQDTSYEVVNDSSGNVANALIRRDSNGDFAANIANFQSLRVDSKTVIDTESLNAGTNAGIITLNSYNGTAAITLGDGDLVSDRKNIYRNDEHVFQSRSGLIAGTINAGTLTTGAAGTAGTLTGLWGLSSGSIFNATSGELRSSTLSTGNVATAGTITGTWSLGSNSSLTVGTGFIDARTGTLYTDTLDAGSTSAAATVTGAWTVGSGSSFVATTVVNQANSATIAASSTNTANNIVRRDASGNFVAGTITAALSGNASTATSAARLTNSRTIALTGDVTGSATFDGSANISISTTVGGNTVELGADTIGQYARTVLVSGLGISINAAEPNDGTDYTITSNATNANTGSTIVYRDASGNFSAGTITASLTGTASQATNSTNINVTANATNGVFYLPFFSGNANGNKALAYDADLQYNPSTNTLTAAEFSGSLSGNATTATRASSLFTTSGYQAGSLGVGIAASGANDGNIRATGNVTAYATSDRNLKENITVIDNALGKLRSISGVMFDWKDTYIESQGGEDGYFVRKHDTGVIAQDVESVLPEAVATKVDGFKAVQYEKLAGIIIQAINELADQIDDIKKKLN